MLIHRRDSLRAEKILQERLFNNKKIEVIWNSKVSEFVGEENPNTLKKIHLFPKPSQAKSLFPNR